MWLLERESPEAAEQLTSALAERGASIAVGFVNWNVNEYAYNSLFRCDELLNEGDFKFQDLDWVGEKAPVGEVGCLPGDVDVFEYLHRLRIGKWTLFDDAFVDRKWRRSNWIFGRTRERLPDWLLTYRLALFKKLNVITWLPKWSAAERVTLPEHFPTLLPSDSEILSKLEQSLSVLDIASQTGDTLGATLQRLKRLSPLLSNPPDVDISPYEDATVTKDELNAVRHGRVALGWVLKTAAASGESVESVVQKLQKFTPFGITLPEISSGAAASVLEDKDNLRLFNEHGTITPTSIVLAAAYIKEPLSATIRRAQQFAALGVSIPQVKPEDFEGLMVEDHVRYVFSRLDVFGESILTGVARSSAATGETVGRILESLEKFRPLGIDIPDVEPRDVTDLVISDTDLQLLSYPYSSISLSKILEVSSEMGEPVNVTYGRAEKLAKLGFRLEKLDLSNVPEIRVSGVDLSHLDVSKNVSVHHLLTASAKAGVTVFEIYERYLRLAPLGVRVPKIDREAAKAISLGQSDLPLLWSDNRVTIFRLLAAACILREPFANTFERAKRLTAFGISVPKLNFTDLKLPIIDREDFLSLTAVGIIRAAASEKKTTVKLAQPVESLMTKLRKSFTKRGDNQEPRLESDTRLLAKVRRYLKESVEWSSTGRGAGLLRLAAKLDAVDFRLDTTVSRREINLVAFIMCEQTALVSARLQKFARFGLRVRGG
jgi:hypothetical protein